MPFLMISAFVFDRFEFSRICFYGLPVTVATVPTKCVLNFTDLTFLRKIFSQIFGIFCQNATRSLLPTKKIEDIIVVKCLNVADIIKVTSLHNSDIIKSFVGGVVIDS